MDANFNKLFKLLIDKGMKKGELGRIAGVSDSSIAKLGRAENVNVDILVRLCQALDCTMDDIIEIYPLNKAEKSDK